MYLELVPARDSPNAGRPSPAFTTNFLVFHNSNGRVSLFAFLMLAVAGLDIYKTGLSSPECYSSGQEAIDEIIRLSFVFPLLSGRNDIALSALVR